MTCRLCGLDRKLIKAHIIPQFMHKGIINPGTGGRIVNFSDLKRAKRSQTGIYDSNILCSNCDRSIFGKYETYGRTIVYPKESELGLYKRSISGSTALHAETAHISGLDYHKTKLFILSILLRSSYSRHEFYSEINLGKYEPMLSAMFLSGDAGDEDNFESCILGIHPSLNISKTILKPVELKRNGNCSYVFIINGAFYMYNISRYNRINLFETGMVTKDGVLNIGFLDREMSQYLVKALLGDRRPIERFLYD